MLFDGVTLSVTSWEIQTNLAKLDCGVDQSPTFMVGDKKTTTNSIQIGAYQVKNNIKAIQTG